VEWRRSMRLEAHRAKTLMVRGMAATINKLLNDLHSVSGADDIEGFLHDLKITLIFPGEMDLSLDSVTAYNLEIAEGYRVFISPRIMSHPDPFKRAVMVNQCAAHELAHIIAHDPPGYYAFEAVHAPPIRDALEALRKYLFDPDIRASIEDRTELLATALLFYPKRQFSNLVWQRDIANYRNISQTLIASLDCCVKWGLLDLPLLPSHYVKFNAETGHVEDFYIPQDVPDYSRFGWDMEGVLQDRKTVAYRAMRTKCDQEGVTTCPVTKLPFYCRAYYVPADPHLQIPAKIIVSGYPESQYDTLKSIAVHS